MNNAIIIFGTTTGNTERVAKWIEKSISDSGMFVKMINVLDSKKEDIKAFDLIVLGASTWGQGEIQDDFLEFFEKMSPDYFAKKKVAVFGCGDSDMFPDNFCDAVDLIADKAQSCGADLVGERLKIDSDIDAYQESVEKWAINLK